ncbi:ribonuclease H-like domain-containing protein [Tanacetum coccineum]
MNQFCGMKGIKREFSVARTPQQNRVVERKNKTLIEAARTILADSLLPTTFWAEAISTACYVQNRVLVTKPQNKTPLMNHYMNDGGASNKEDNQNVQDFRVTLDNLLVPQKKGYANSTNKDSTVSPSVGHMKMISGIEAIKQASPIETTKALHKMKKLRMWMFNLIQINDVLDSLLGGLSIISFCACARSVTLKIPPIWCTTEKVGGSCCPKVLGDRMERVTTIASSLEVEQDSVKSLESDLKQTKLTYGAAYTKLIMKVKKLENRIKSSKARRRVKLIVSEDEGDLEDPSK